MQYKTETPANLLKMIKRDEGFKPRIYTDTEGFQTIGIGFCLDKTLIPEPVADFWAAYILDGLERRIRVNLSIGQTYKELNQARQWAILNMCYQMGLTGVCGFLNMWGALDEHDYPAAADHAKDSIWYHQTPARAKRVIEVIKTGELKIYRL